MHKYRRNPDVVLNQLKSNVAGQILTKVPCKIHIPARFTEVGLGQVGITTFTYGIFALILESGEYAVCNVSAMVELNPFKTTIVTIEEVDYYEFSFEAGDIVIKTTDLVKRDTLMYNVMDELIFKGKIPWYVGYEDLGKLFDTAKRHANSNVGQNLEVIEFIAAMVTRSKKDRTKYIRSVANNYQDTDLDKLEYVPLKSIFYSVKSTVNKLTGAYFNDGVVSALVNPSEGKAHKIETILRA